MFSSYLNNGSSYRIGGDAMTDKMLRLIDELVTKADALKRAEEDLRQYKEQEANIWETLSNISMFRRKE